MKENFEIEKELKFNSNLAEVLSISLEEKHEVENNKLIGHFIVSGEYKIHEISLNKEKFNFKIPYEHEITSDIDENTLNVEISNFIYDSDKESLYVTIDYEVVGDRKDILLFDDEENLEEFLKSREVEVIMDEVIDEIDESLEKNIEEIKEEKVIKDLEAMIEENNDIVVEKIEKKSEKESEENREVDESLEPETRNMEDAKKELLNSVNVGDDNFITYQIHIVKETDTLETILVKYKMSLDELKEYNEFNNLSLGMKLIIPIVNEE